MFATRPLFFLVVLVLLLPAGGCKTVESTSESVPLPAVEQRRAILVSFDALHERRIFETLPASATPSFRRLFEGGACAAFALPAFPSVTAPGHAALWTGAFGDVTGIVANSQPRLPRDQHTLLESVSGFSNEGLRAEPFWITAARAGRRAVGHHVTQAPAAPGYPAINQSEEATMAARRAEAERILAQPNVTVLNGYNTRIATDRVLTQENTAARVATGWEGLARVSSTSPAPLEIAWAVGADSLFALIHGEDGRFDRVTVSPNRNAAAGVTAVAAPLEESAPHGRALARHFSRPLEWIADEGRSFVRVRLFEMAPDASTFMLFQAPMHVVDGNRAEAAASYDAVVQGWVGNGATWQVGQGNFGVPLSAGGDGTAERRYVETAELAALTTMVGTSWAWRNQNAEILMDYLAIGDEVDHMLSGLTEPRSPFYDERAAAIAQEVRAHVWGLADIRLDSLMSYVAEDPGVLLLVAGDHGMRAIWQEFRPSVALENAGLLARGEDGRIDLSRTRALSPNGYFVAVNRLAWQGGIVPPEEEAAVIELASQALLGARGHDGEPIVTRIFRAAEDDSLGLGGPVGGDLYYELAEGYQYSSAAGGQVSRITRAFATHGFPSIAPDMHTAFCAAGQAFRPNRTSPAMIIDAAPTAAEWLGVPAPPDARGRSRLGEFLGRP